MRTEHFSYDLPHELIAQEPAPEREAARLLIVGERFLDDRVANLAEHVPVGALVVVNDTRVIRARIVGNKEGSGGRAEVFLVRPEGDGLWRAMARASKPLKQGTRIIAGALVAEIEGRTEDMLFLVRLSANGLTLDEALEKHARVPLPPYIKRDPSAADEARYQTVYARAPGAVAAPTAGLHLTERLIEQLKAQGCSVAACTLHVGLGTFQPVSVDDLDDHPMHSEAFEVSPALVAAVSAARARDAPVLAVGTTVVRALESAADEARPGHIRACAEETRLLIQPEGRPIRVVDRLLTNFHLPKSTLLALVCAFAGTERVLAAYRTAVERRYRFFSYGDAMLLERSP